jgi:amino acid adenylation domain-containing protein
MAPLTFLPSPAQERLWLLEQLRPGEPTYNMALAFRLTGALDVPALHRALRTVVDRHEVLRTTFAVRDDRLVQVVARDVPTALPVEPVDEATLRQRLAEEPALIFDLGRGPLFAARLFRLGAEEHVLLLRMHHIVFDAWSMSVLTHQLGLAYAGAELPAPAVQYADFAAWQRESHDASDQLAQWRAQLTGAPVPPRLPADRASAAPPGSHGFILPDDLTAELRTLARTEGATLFMVLLAGLAAVLGRYTRQDDMVVGTPVAGRDQPELEDLIGLFVNTLALRVRTSGNPTFRELLGRVREVCLHGYENADVPFQRVVEELRPERELLENPFFRVLFALHNTPAPVLELPGLTVRREPLPPLLVPFDLVVSIVDDGHTLTCRLDHGTPFGAARFAGHLGKLLAAAAADPDLPVAGLPVLTAAEHRDAVGGPVVSPPVRRCLHELVAEQAVLRPDAVAVTDGSACLRYGTLVERAGRLAGVLRLHGVGPEVLVGVCVDRSADLVVALLAVLTAGGAYLPLDPAHPDARLAHLASQADVLLAAPATATRLAGPFVVLDDWAIRPARSPSSGRTVPDNLAYVIHTSGSTGTPNGVLVTHTNVVRLLASCRPLFDVGPDDVWTLSHSFAFDFSVWELWGALTSGGRVVVVPREVAYSPTEFLALLGHERVTVLSQTPSAFAQLDQADTEAGTPELALRLVILGGEAVDPGDLRGWFARRGAERPTVVNMYGITETTVHVTHRPMAPGDEPGTSPIGVPLPDLRALVLDEAMNPLPVGVPGELYVGGLGLARGYLDQPGLTAARFRADPYGPPGGRLYRTGDLAWRSADGSLEFAGRTDEQVKLRGYRIEPGEVRAALLAHPDVDAAAVVLREDGARRLVGYVVGRAEPATLRAFLADRLPEHMVPGALVPLDRLPLTHNGKLDRAALPDPDASRPALPVSLTPARTPVEEALTTIWAEVFELTEVGVHDDFLELGGHSQLAVRLCNRIRDRLGVELPVRAVFEHPTIAELGRLVNP